MILWLKGSIFLSEVCVTYAQGIEFRSTELQYNILHKT